MDFRWRDVDPDIRWFCTWGVAIIAGYFFLRWLGAWWGGESHIRGRCYLFRWPSHRAMNAIRARLRELTDRRRWAGMKDIRDVIAVLNPVLRGWGNYFRTGNATKQFTSLDRFVTSRLTRLIAQREGLQRRPFFLRRWPHTRFVDDFNLYKLLGTIRYPGGTHAT